MFVKCSPDVKCYLKLKLIAVTYTVHHSGVIILKLKCCLNLKLIAVTYTVHHSGMIILKLLRRT